MHQTKVPREADVEAEALSAQLATDRFFVLDLAVAGVIFQKRFRWKNIFARLAFEPRTVRVIDRPRSIVLISLDPSEGDSHHDRLLSWCIGNNKVFCFYFVARGLLVFEVYAGADGGLRGLVQSPDFRKLLLLFDGIDVICWQGVFLAVLVCDGRTLVRVSAWFWVHIPVLTSRQQIDDRGLNSFVSAFVF